jgi:hypothetical protein
MRIGGTCYVGTTLSKHPGRRWVVVAWTDGGEHCALAGLPERPSTPLTEVKGDEARLIASSELLKATDGGVLVQAGGLGTPAVGLVVRGLLNDRETPARVRALLSQRL